MKKIAWNQAIGKKGESLAERFFIDRGFTILEKNYRTPYGELDLIIKKEREIAFIEVKTRTGQEFGFGESSVDEIKMDHLVSSAEHYIAVEPVDTESWRIDVLAVQLREGLEPEFVWFENVS